MKKKSIHELVQEIKHREQQELIEALRKYGNEVNGYYEWHFEDECPIVAAYDYDDPADVVILSARVDKDGSLSFIGDQKEDRGNEHKVWPDDIFAGHVDVITDSLIFEHNSK